MLPFDEQLLLTLPTGTNGPVEPMPVFYLHAGEHPICTRQGCICQRNAVQLRQLLLSVINGDLTLHQQQNGIVRMEGSNGT